MSQPISLRRHLRRSILKQSMIGAVAIVLVLFAVGHFVGRYQAATDLRETALASAKAFRSRILEGDIKAVQGQLSDVLKLENGEGVFILDPHLNPVYRDASREAPSIGCHFIGTPCISSFGSAAEVLMPIYFDQDGKNLFGYLYLSRAIHLDWVFLGLVSVIFILGYFAVFFGVTRITKSTILLLAASLEAWAQRLNQNPKDAASLSETPFSELLPLKAAIEGLNHQIEGFESKAAEEAKLLILRGIAHDLLGPVSQAQLYLATLKKKTEFEPHYAPLIGKAMDSVRDVAEVASQVKMLKESPDPGEHINLAVEARLQVQSLRESDAIRSKELDLEFDSSSTSDLDASLSSPELRRILQNLVQNSAHASRARAKIEVSVRRDGDHAILSVRDHGHGIPQTLQKKVFQPDFTLKPGTGTGLGLAIVKYIAKARSGFVELASTSAGTLVEVRIPVFSEKGASLCSES